MKKHFPERYNKYMTKGRREQIHKESKVVDDTKNLPFTFSKPNKPKSTRDAYQCDKCDRVIPMDASRTKAIICRCNNYIVVEEAKINVIRDGE